MWQRSNLKCVVSAHLEQNSWTFSPPYEIFWACYGTLPGPYQSGSTRRLPWVQNFMGQHFQKQKFDFFCSFFLDSKIFCNTQQNFKSAS